MRTIVAITCALGVLALTSPLANAHRTASKLCRLGSRPHPVAIDTQAQVYGFVAKLAERPYYYGCVYGHKPYRLGVVPEESSGGVEFLTLNGVMVAYQEGAFNKYTPLASWIIAVRNLLTGKIVHRIPTGAYMGTEGSTGIGSAEAIVVKSDGSVAWIATDSEEKAATHGPYYQVHAVDKAGSRVLAAGSMIEPHSLALAGNTIYWTEEGKPLSASLE